MCIARLLLVRHFLRNVQRSPRRRASTESRHLPLLTLYTKNNCCLCDELKNEIKPHKHRFAWDEVDIEAPPNADWLEKYRYHIPVLHLNGKFLLWHKLDLELLDTRLTELESRADDKHKTGRVDSSS